MWETQYIYHYVCNIEETCLQGIHEIILARRKTFKYSKKERYRPCHNNYPYIEDSDLLCSFITFLQDLVRSFLGNLGRIFFFFLYKIYVMIYVPDSIYIFKNG